MKIEVGVQKKPLFIVVYDPRKLSKLMGFLDSLGVEYRGLDPNIDRVEGVVIVDEGGKEYLTRRGVKVRGIMIELDNDVVCAALRATTASCKGSAEANEIILGIDFGQRIGIAVVIDSVVVVALSFRSSFKALELVATILRCIDAAKKVIRVGMPRKEDPEYDNFINKLIKMVSEDTQLELVPECGSSRLVSFLKLGKKLDDDSLAAINIALARSE